MPEAPRNVPPQARKARIAASVMAATMVLWMGAQLLGGQLGLPVRFILCPLSCTPVITKPLFCDFLFLKNNKLTYLFKTNNIFFFYLQEIIKKTCVDQKYGKLIKHRHPRNPFDGTSFLGIL